MDFPVWKVPMTLLSSVVEELMDYLTDAAACFAVKTQALALDIRHVTNKVVFICRYNTCI